MAVVSDVSRVKALERTRASSLPETLSDKQVHTTHSEMRCNAGKPLLVGLGKLSGIPRTRAWAPYALVHYTQVSSEIDEERDGNRVCEYK
jgi:hypothetical protein